MIRVAYLLPFVLLGCEQQKFGSTSPRPPQVRKAEAYPIQVSTRSISRARQEALGQGEVIVRTGKDAEVICLDCPSNIALSFKLAGQQDGELGDHAASFSYPFVQDTQLCPVSLQVRYPSGKTENVKYALYFCPVDLSAQVRNCDKVGARRVCNI